MSVIVENGDGWIIDHQLATVLTVQKNDLEKGDIAQQYRLKSDLFEIVEPYCMDSQYEKLQSVQLTDEGPKKRKRKRKRQEPLNSGEQSFQEFHNEVKDYVWKAYESLLKLGQEAAYFHDHGGLCVKDNNKTARFAAQWDGSMNFIDMCEQSQQVGNQTLHVDQCTGSQQPWTSDAEELQDRKQCVTIYQVTEVKDLSIRGVVNLVWQHTGEFSKVVKCKGDNYIVPVDSSFLMSDIQHLKTHGKALGTYDLIVMDPPWTNKSVKRKRKYYTMDNDMMLDLPLGDMMNSGCVIVVWVTNKQKHRQFVTEQLFPTHSISSLARWFWLKVTKTGQCVSEIDSAHKKPYETIIIGKYHRQTCYQEIFHSDSSRGFSKCQAEKGSCQLLDSNCEKVDHYMTYSRDFDISRSDSCFNVTDIDKKSRTDGYQSNRYYIPDNRVIVSVPSSLHSKKPPLKELLQPYLPEKPKCLELFARNLQQGWTSWGNEALLHQHINFYEEIT